MRPLVGCKDGAGKNAGAGVAGVADSGGLNAYSKEYAAYSKAYAAQALANAAYSVANVRTALANAA
jgi:hypothetical protein